MIECQLCGRKPSDEPGDVHLERVNEKGVPGIWHCAQGTGCNKFEDLQKSAAPAKPAEGPAAKEGK